MTVIDFYDWDNIFGFIMWIISLVLIEEQNGGKSYLGPLERIWNSPLSFLPVDINLINTETINCLADINQNQIIIKVLTFCKETKLELWKRPAPIATNGPKISGLPTFKSSSCVVNSNVVVVVAGLVVVSIVVASIVVISIGISIGISIVVIVVASIVVISIGISITVVVVVDVVVVVVVVVEVVVVVVVVPEVLVFS